MSKDGGKIMDVVKVENVSKIYGQDGAKVEALKDVNFNVKQGEFVAIIGPSGSGKSTLLHILGGVDTPTKGKVIIDGEDIIQLSEKKRAVFRRRKVGFVFQQYNLMPVLTAEENIMLPLLLDNKKVDTSYLEELLSLLSLKERRTHLPSELSGGQMQRVAIARALIYKPSIILADEPTGNLDSKNGREIVNLLKMSVKKYHQTLIMITHDPNIASEADRIIKIEDGMIQGKRGILRCETILG